MLVSLMSGRAVFSDAARRRLLRPWQSGAIRLAVRIRSCPRSRRRGRRSSGGLEDRRLVPGLRRTRRPPCPGQRRPRRPV